MKKLLFTITTAALLLSGLSLLSQSNYNMAKKIQIGGEGGWDYLTVDGGNNRLFVSHANLAHVIDIKSGQSVGTIPDTKGIHGIAIANDLNKGFTSNGRDSSLTVFNLKTLEVIAIIKVDGQNPDAILYDSFSKRVFTGNGRSASFSVVDALTNKEIAVIPLDGKPEAIVTDGKGKIYVNIEDESRINVIDASTLKVIDSWPINPGEEPTGLALDNQSHLLFSACSNELLVVVDALTGKVVTTVPIGRGCDGAAFDPMYKRIYTSNGEGTMTVVQEGDHNTFKVLETVSTQPGARTITIDTNSHHLYLSAAEYESAPSESNRRPPVKPESFGVLDIETLK